MEIYVGIVIVMIILFIAGKAMYQLGYKTGLVDMEREFQKEKWH